MFRYAIIFGSSDEENSKVKGLNFFDGKVKKIVSKIVDFFIGMV